MNARWVNFQGAPVYIDIRTESLVRELGGRISEKKDDHIPSFIPKTVSFTFEDVKKLKVGKDGKVISWKGLSI